MIINYSFKKVTKDNLAKYLIINDDITGFLNNCAEKLKTLNNI